MVASTALRAGFSTWSKLGQDCSCILVLAKTATCYMTVMPKIKIHKAFALGTLPTLSPHKLCSKLLYPALIVMHLQIT